MRSAIPLLSFLFALPAAAAERPNVILVMTDDQGYGDLACHGNPEIKTPNLDRLHSQSLRLTDFHVTPMCTPTRGQLLSGRDALRNGAMNVSSGRSMLRHGLPTIADIFSTSGYRTGQFGKWHVGDTYPYRPQDRGFQEALFFPSSHIGSAADYWNNDYFDDVFEHNGVRRRFEGYCTDVFFNEAMRWMRACHAEGKPFFAYIPTNAPHGPLFVPSKYREAYRHLPRNVASFFGMIANIDENLGRLDAMLNETGLRDNTILIFLTDNGGTAGVPTFNAGMRGRKTELYEGGHRVPCFIRWPGGKLRAPGDLPDLTICQDLIPTFIDLCGLQTPSGAAFDGVSLARLLRGETDRLSDRKVVIQFSRIGSPVPKKGDAAVLWNRWRLINDTELYDLQTDPAQKTDVAARHPEIVQALREHYERWWNAIEPAVNELSPIHVGSTAEDPTLLSACDWQDSFLDQGRQVRQGLAQTGHWGLVVDHTGDYEIALRRWPSEADLPLTAPAPEHHGPDGTYPAGVPLPIARARLQVGGLDETKPVGSQDRAVVFRARLNAGPARLQATFLDAQGKELCSAYYVYVHRLGSTVEDRHLREIQPDPSTGTSRAVVVSESDHLAYTTQLWPVDAGGTLVGQGDAGRQTDALLDRLEAHLREVQSGLDRLVKVNVYAAGPDALGPFRMGLMKRLAGRTRPAISVVVGELARPGALLALDAVAIAPAALGAEHRRPRVAILPAGPRVFISGQADPGATLAEATRHTLEGLEKSLRHIGLDRTRVVQIKAFMQPMSAAAEVEREVAAFFGHETVPPTVLVAWKSEKPPIEIELVATGAQPADESVDYVTPPGLTASPVYSRIARVHHGDLLFVSNLYGQPGTSGQEQVEAIFDALGPILQEAGTDLRHLVKATYYVSDDEASRALNELRPRYYDPARPPAASKAAVEGVGAPGRTVTLDLIGVLPR